MFWGKRRFKYAEFGPYQERLADLQMANARLYPQFIMVSVETEPAGESEYYVGVPSKALLSVFDGFEEVSEAELPKEIDTVLLADTTKDEFTSRFTLKRIP